MISLVKMEDAAGKVYCSAGVLAAFDNEVKIFEISDNDTEVMVQISKEVRPQLYEIKKMCMCELGDDRSAKNLLWPKKELYDISERCFCGFIAEKPEIKGELILLEEVIHLRKEKIHLKKEEKKYYAEIGIQMAQYFEMIHATEKKFIFGSVSPSDFCVDERGTLFCFHTYECARNHPRIRNPYYIAPELIGMETRKVLYNEESDSFLYALMLFQLMTGKFPFAPDKELYSIEKEEMEAWMSDGQSIYFEEDSEECAAIEKVLNEFSAELAEACRFAFDYCGRASYVQGRPTIKEWRKILESEVGDEIGKE